MREKAGLVATLTLSLADVCHQCAGQLDALLWPSQLSSLCAGSAQRRLASCCYFRPFSLIVGVASGNSLN